MFRTGTCCTLSLQQATLQQQQQQQMIKTTTTTETMMASIGGTKTSSEESLSRDAGQRISSTRQKVIKITVSITGMMGVTSWYEMIRNGSNGMAGS
jgi:hypothetical protein